MICMKKISIIASSAKQSRLFSGHLDCFALLAIDGFCIKVQSGTYGHLGNSIRDFYDFLTAAPGNPYRKLASIRGIFSAVHRTIWMTCGGVRAHWRASLIESSSGPGQEERPMSYAMVTGLAVVLAAGAVCYLYFKDVV